MDQQHRDIVLYEWIEFATPRGNANAERTEVHDLKII